VEGTNLTVDAQVITTAQGVQDPLATTSRGKFAVDLLKLTSGTILAQTVSILAAPLIARLFDPQAFGSASLFTSIASVMGIVVCLRYDRAIILPAQDKEAFDLFGVSIFAALLVSTMAIVMVTAGKTVLFVRLKSPDLQAYLWLVPLNVFFLGVLSALNSWKTRKRGFTAITIAQVLSSACYICFSIIAGVTGHTNGGYLILGAFFGSVISVLTLVVPTAGEGWFALLRTINPKHMLKAVHRYKRFPKYSAGAGILYSISWELPVLFLSAFFSPAVVGQYALGNRIVRLPMSFLGLNISRVFSQRAAQAKHDGTLAPFVDKTFHSLVSFGMFPFLLLVLIGRPLFSVVFGGRWAEAGTYTEILSAWAFFWFLSATLSSALDVLEEQAFELRMNVLILITRLVSLLIGGLAGSPRISLVLFSASGVTVYGYYCFAIVNKCGLPASRVIQVLLREFLKCIPFGIVIILTRYVATSSVVSLAVSTIMLLTYYFSVIRDNAEIRQMLYALTHRYAFFQTSRSY